jgi:hypothetical protein
MDKIVIRDLIKDLALEGNGIMILKDGMFRTENVYITDVNHFEPGDLRLVALPELSGYLDKRQDSDMVMLAFDNPFDNEGELFLTLDIKMNCGYGGGRVCNFVWASGKENNQISKTAIFGSDMEKMTKAMHAMTLDEFAGCDINTGLSALSVQKTIKVEGDKIYIGFFSSIPWYIKEFKKKAWGGIQVDIISASLKEPICDFLGAKQIGHPSECETPNLVLEP